ncbi:MAG: circularly permuted type 2 ATP-grasp protein [Magnetococcales bacterium]|nr:circularly permuted type 2 ATP-grasp protein [Magnetococcales bacterium]
MSQANPSPNPIRGLFADYAPPPGYDEAVDSRGLLRDHWKAVVLHLQEMEPQRLANLREQARQLLLENGVTYDAYNTTPESCRTWDLDLLPWILTETEWAQLEKGLRQHHRLLEHLLNDLYGEQDVLKAGLLPASLIYGDERFLRCCQGWDQPHPWRIRWGAVDVARQQNGAFRILGNPLQTPTGVGYALENRQIFFRLLRETLNENQVRLLLPFFTALRTHLIEASPLNKEDPRSVLLSPGPSSELFFEHAFLANYLGLPLVLGEDLAVRGGRVHFKTLEGLYPVDVILRLLEDRHCDPLELGEKAGSGVAGLVQALREQRTSVINPLGVGILENPALPAYLPELCRHYLQETPLLSHTPTLWCGDALQTVLEAPDTWIISRLDERGNPSPLPFGDLSREKQAALQKALKARPADFVARKASQPSSLPLLLDESAAPGYGILRTFFTAGTQGVEVMPGGLARVARAGEPLNAFDSPMGRVKDVWILSSQPVARANRPPLESLYQPSAFTGEISSRTAENLYWVGRYAERAENILRLLRVVLLLPAMGGSDGVSVNQQESLRLIYRAASLMTDILPGFAGEGAEQRLQEPEEELHRIIVSTRHPGSIVSSLQALILSSHRVRERLSNDTWRVIHRLRELVSRLSGLSSTPEMLVELEELIMALGSLSGLAMENMTRGLGWHFMVLGRRLERSLLTVDLLRTTLVTPFSPEAERPLLEALLAATNSTMTFRRRYRTHLFVKPFLDLILADETNPRAIAFQLEALERHITKLPRRVSVPTYRTPEGRIILEALNAVRLANTDLLSLVTDAGGRPNLEQLLSRLHDLLPLLSVELSNGYFQHTTAHARKGLPG